LIVQIYLVGSEASVTSSVSTGPGLPHLRAGRVPSRHRHHPRESLQHRQLPPPAREAV